MLVPVTHSFLPRMKVSLVSPHFLVPLLVSAFKQLINSVFMALVGCDGAEREEKKFPNVTKMGPSINKRFRSKHYLW